MSRPSSSTRVSLLIACLFSLVAGLGLGLFVAPRAADMAGFHVALEPEEGRPTESVVRFGGDTPPRLPNLGDTRPKNLILLIGDGMGFSQLTAGRMATVGADGRLVIERMPVTGWSLTHSVDQIYTDSASGASALSTGVKTSPQRIATDAAGVPQRSLFEKAHAAGMSVGTVTDSMILDATPAAFVAHSPKRRDYAVLVDSTLELRPELFVGGLPHPLGESETWDSRWALFDAAGYVRLGPNLELDPADPRPVLGLLPADAMADGSGPSLDRVAAFALERLGTDEDGFMLLLETEETDTGSHNGQFEQMVRGVAALDRAAEVALRFAEARGDTLVLVTADHETGGLALLEGLDGEPVKVRWATDSHSAEPVPVLAYGPGSTAFSGVLDNAEIGRLLSDLFFAPTDEAQAADAPKG